MVFSSSSGLLSRKSISYLTKLGTSWHNGLRTKSITLLSLCVGDVCPATIGLIFRSAGGGNFMYSAFCFLTASLMISDL